MTSKDIIKVIIADSQSAVLPNLWQRSLVVPVNSGKIITLAGVRRSGKTYHLFQIMKDLLAQGIGPHKLLYINFQDERIQLDGSELDVILQAYRELHPDIDFAECYFFFDEVQEIRGWEKFVDRLYSSLSKNVFITGSNSKMLSREIATSLRGRTVTYEVYPLSFAEFVGVVRPGTLSHSSKDRAFLLSLFEKFMTNGGFPELVGREQGLLDNILQEYFNVMLFRDLIERFGVTQTAALKYFCKRLVGSSAGEFSVNKIYNELKSQGYSIGRETLYDFRDNVEAIYLNRFVPKYSYSVVKSEGSVKKTYIIDQGMGASLDFKLAGDKGRLLENTVALELLKQGKVIAYWQDEVECDFVVIEKNQVTLAMQVSLDIGDPKTRTREMKGIVACCKALGLGEGYIVTLNTWDELEIDGIHVHVVPVWSYFQTKV
jgi:uncharacterized protein